MSNNYVNQDKCSLAAGLLTVSVSGEIISLALHPGSSFLQALNTTQALLSYTSILY